MDRTKLILVTGDVTIDHNLFRLPAPQSQYTDWNDDDRADVCRSQGGAGLLGQLTADVAEKLSVSSGQQIRVVRPVLQALADQNDSIGNSYVVWAPHPATSEPKCKEQVWRVERFLGMRKPSASHIEKAGEGEGAPDVLVINDVNLGFADDQSAWPACLLTGAPPRWILLKTSQLQVQTSGSKTSALWKHLQAKFADRLIVHVTVNSLRESQIQISRGISWERTAQDLFWELRYHLFGQPLLAQHTSWNCAHAVVTLNAAGALLFSPQNDVVNGGSAVLVYSPKTMEAEWEKGYPGKVVGSASCFSAALAVELAQAADRPDLEKAVRAALCGLRELYRDGYGKVDKSAQRFNCLAFPYAAISTTITASLQGQAPKNKDDLFVTGGIPADLAQTRAAKAGDPTWSLLGQNPMDLAIKIVKQGTKAVFTTLPVASFGGLETADRREIEGFRGISNLLQEYIDKRESKPLSFAVFGPPGSGKSFGVKEIAKGLSRDAEIKTFNLSQFGSPTELIAAFHQVRDLGLSGKLPVIFWDEFDTKLHTDLGWLRYFLEPMQDGTFLEDQITHPIGRAIFVFAGGTRASFERFSHPKDAVAFRDAKGPDFVSRLRGFLNILGPNPIGGNPEQDKGHVIRRAILLRSMLSRTYPNLLNGDKVQMDDGVLSAFLRVRFFRHGARSMESILAASALNGKTYFGRSCLPPLPQLGLHVDGVEFQALVEEMDGLENLAQAMHRNYCEKLKARGYTYGSPSNEDKKVSASLVDFEQLPAHLKDENAAAAKDMPRKLASAGFAILPAREGLVPVDFTREEIDRMAELEHDRWMRRKLKDGWSYDKVRDDKAKKHPALLPWRDITPEERAALYPEAPDRVGLTALPEAEKDKDRDQFIGLSSMLARYGCAVVKLEPMPEIKD